MRLVVDPSVFDPRLAQLDVGLPQRGTLVAQRYRVGEGIGEGGMSVLFSARDERLGRDVALKLLNPQLAYSREIVTRFVNEARTLAQLDCPHVVRVFDAGVADEPGHPPLPFMVLELLRGVELRAMATPANGADFRRVVGWMLQVCDGLAAAHVEGIIHRDLKPENLFVVDETDGSQIVKVLDFGIARSMEVASTLTMDGERIGSPGYMSPEQIRDVRTVDERSDIWSLGVIMYELFAGVAPFQAANSVELCLQILNGSVAPLRELRPDLPLALSAVVERCMQRSVAARFVNIADLAEALSPYAHPETVEVASRVRRRLRSRGSNPTSVRPVADFVLAESEERPLEPSSELRLPEVSVVAALRVRSGTRRGYRRLLAVAALVGGLSFLALTLVPRASERSREFVVAAGTRLAGAAQGLLAR